MRVNLSEPVRCRSGSLQSGGDLSPAVGIAIFSVNHALVDPTFVAGVALRMRPLERGLGGIEGPQTVVGWRTREGIPSVFNFIIDVPKLPDVEEARRPVVKAVFEPAGYPRASRQPQVRESRTATDRLTKPDELLDSAPSTKCGHGVGEGQMATHDGSVALPRSSQAGRTWPDVRNCRKQVSGTADERGCCVGNGPVVEGMATSAGSPAALLGCPLVPAGRKA